MLVKEGKVSPLRGRRLFAASPPKLKKKRAADSLKSGFVDMGEKRDRTLDRAIREAVRVLGGKPGEYHAVEASRRFAYERPNTNFGSGVASTVIPRIHFSAPIERKPDSKLPYNRQERYDYDSRFPLGTGPMAVDEENRIIHTWSNEMASMADTIWKAMKEDDRYRRLCKAGNEFNHVSVHAYRAGHQIQDHEDRRRERRRRNRRNQRAIRNSMKEGTAVAVFTIGSPRQIFFSRKYKEDGQLQVEPQHCYEFMQEHGSLFALDPADEELKMRRNWWGAYRKDSLFVHKVKCGREQDYFSVAFVFRCLDTTAVVDATTDRVIPEAPANESEKARRQSRAALRAKDEKEGSDFKKQVAQVREEWRRLMRAHKWI